MGIIGTEESKNEIIRMNSASMIYDEDKLFNLKHFS